VTEHGDLDVLLIGRRAEPKKVKEPADEQERNRAAHPADLASPAKPLLKTQILCLHPTTRLTHAASTPASYGCAAHCIADPGSLQYPPPAASASANSSVVSGLVVRADSRVHRWCWVQADAFIWKFAVGSATEDRAQALPR